MQTSRLNILLADDDDGNAALIRRNLERAGIAADLRRVRDGLELIELLNREISAAFADRPLLVLLDVSMPRMNGIEALNMIRADPRTRFVPVYMLTTTDNPADVSRCFRAGCNAYLTKPVVYEEFVATIERLCAFLVVSQIPLVSASA